MSPDPWPIDTPKSTMFERVRARAAEHRRRRWTRNMVVAGTLVVLGASGLYLASSPTDPSLRTTPADNEGAAAGETSDVTMPPLRPGDVPPAVTPGPGSPRPGNVGGPLPAVAPATTSTTRPVPKVTTGDIAFTRDQRIWLVRADGTGAGPLTDASRKLEDADWAPDGRRLVAVEPVGTDVTAMPVARLVVVGMDGNVQRTISEGNYGRPHWSPDGSRIAFTRVASYTPLRFELWSIRPDGSDERKLSQRIEGEFSWSPDGSRLAFTGEQGMATMKADGSDVRVIPGMDGHLTPTWSPDGQRLAVTFLDEAGRSSIRTVRLDGSDRRHVIDATAYDMDWSPDSRTLVFIEPGPEQTTRMVRVEADGTGRRVIASGTTTYYPSWRPS